MTKSRASNWIESWPKWEQDAAEALLKDNMTTIKDTQPRNILVRTASGSLYEVRHDRRAVRRLEGKHDPSERVGEGWRNCIGVVLAKHLVILWTEDVPLLPGSNPDKHWPGTRTSEIVEITEVEPE